MIINTVPFSGKVKPYQQPYYNKLDVNPSVEAVSKVVNGDGYRPELPKLYLCHNKVCLVR